MAIAASTIWEVRTGGNDNNGGGFNPQRTFAGTDYSLQDSPQVTIDGSTISATVHTNTSIITLSGYTVNAGDIGNHINITGGTATAGIYEITTIDDVNNRWTLDRSAGTAAQTVEGRMGGAFATVPKAFSSCVAQNTIFLKYSATAYTLSAQLTWNGKSGTMANPTSLIGYDTTRTRFNTDANRPVIEVSSWSSGSYMIDVQINYAHIANIVFDVKNQTGVGGIRIDGAVSTARNVHVKDARNYHFTGDHRGHLFNCSANGGNVTAAFFASLSIRCVARDLNGMGFFNCISFDSIALNVSSRGFFWNHPNAQGRAIRCTSRAAGTNAFEAENCGVVLFECVAWGSGGWGYTSNNVHNTGMLVRCAAGSNTSGAVNKFTAVDPITLIADPHVSSTDLTPNTTAGGGALLRGIAFAYPDSATTTYPDIGAVQSASSGGSTVIVIED